MAEKGDQVKALFDALEGSSFAVAITGAGISIAAGGVTYAGMGSRMGGRNDLLSNDPDRMYRAYYDTFLSALFEHGPTEAHKALARLERMGKMKGIITTNVDCLHTAAGSENVAEVQGSFQVNICENRRCGFRVNDYGIWNRGSMPLCPNCGGKLLPYNMYSHAGIYQDGLKYAQQLMSRADLILIIGATGCYTHMYWGYKKRDAGIIQINPGRTYFDSEADMNIRRESDPVFVELMKLFDEREASKRGGPDGPGIGL